MRLLFSADLPKQHSGQYPPDGQLKTEGEAAPIIPRESLESSLAAIQPGVVQCAEQRGEHRQREKVGASVM